MLAGAPYNTRDPELIALYWRARSVLQEFNAALAERERMTRLRALIPGIAEGVWIEPPFFCEYGPHIRIGARTYLNVNCLLQDCAAISIGEDTLIGPGVQVCTASHPVSSGRRVVRGAMPDQAPYVTTASPINIGSRVWIGANVVLVGGVTVGDDAVIGAGSVVTRDVPAGKVAVGVPCRVVKDASD